MSIPVFCRQCGYRGLSQAFSFSNSTNITIENCTESCPRCGGEAEIQSGTYDFVGEVITAFRAPGMTHAKVSAFADIISEAAEGKISLEEATIRAAVINPVAAKSLELANSRGIMISTMAAIISLILAFWQLYSSDIDAEAALRKAQNQTALMQKILEELEKEPVSHLARPAKQPTERPAQGQNAVVKNRHERRKVAAIERAAK